MIKDQSDLNDESQDLFHDSNDELQWPFQSSSDQDIYKYVLSNDPSFLSSSQCLIQEEICADLNFEFACIETLESHDLSVEVKNSVQ